MFISKKHIPRRTVLRGAGAMLALAVPRRDGAGAGAAGAVGRGSETAVRRPVRSARGGARILGAGKGRRASRPAAVQLAAARAVPRQDRDLQRPALALRGAASRSHGRGSLGGRGVHVRREAEEDRRRRRARRHDDRSAHRAEDWQRQPDPVAADGGRGPGRQLEQLRRRLQLRLHEHDFVGVADLAAADGAESAGGVRADVRRRHDDRAARGASEARPEHSGLADRQHLTPAQRPWRERPSAARRIHAAGAGDPAAPADRHQGVRRRAGEHRSAGRCAADVRRAHQAAVRSAGAGVRGRHHPRRHAALRARPDRAHVSGQRGADVRLPRRFAPRRGAGADRAVVEDQSVPREDGGPPRRPISPRSRKATARSSITR